MRRDAIRAWRQTLCAALLLLGAARLASGALDGFGDRVVPHPALPEGLQLDFDGDGRADRLDVVRVAAGAPLRQEIRVANPWRRTQLPRRGAPLALAITLSSGSRHLVFDDEFFATPIWQNAPLPLAVALRGSPGSLAFAKLAKGARGDLVRLGTEAGIDIVLYWNGRDFRLAWPDEQP